MPPSLTWSYGVTTIPERMEPYGPTSYLTKTLGSLAGAGFPAPHLFVDGPSTSGLPTGYPYTIRGHRLRTFGNWVLAAWELYLLNPHADRYAIFQDDLLMSRNARAYLERCTYPAQGYLNLYTFPENEQDKQGWYLSNQLGKGAVGLVFDNATLRALLASETMVERPLNRERGWRNLDGGIVTAMLHAGIKEYVHNPSLIQHQGDVSSINCAENGLANRVHQKAKTFRGEAFDCLSLLDDPKPLNIQPRGKRVGLVGHHCATEVGDFNLKLVELLDAEQWMVKPHITLPTRDPHPDVDTIVCYIGKEDKLEKFVRAVDVVVYVGGPVYEELVPKCREFNRRIVCFVGQGEVSPGDADLFVCLTEESYKRFQGDRPCAYVPWPKNEAQLPLMKREFSEIVRLGQTAMSLLPGASNG